MSFATGAMDFGPGKDQFVIGRRFDHFGVDRLPKAGPAGAAVELMLRRIGREVTACAIVDTRFLIIVHVVGKRALGTFVPQDLVGLRREEFSPLLVGFHNFDNRADFNFWWHRRSPSVAEVDDAGQSNRAGNPYIGCDGRAR
jgi:hypothetical protein